MLAQKSENPRKGSSNRFARDNQLLPNEWGQLQLSDLRRIQDTLSTKFGKAASLKQLEACLMLTAMITTARNLETLLPLSVKFVGRNPDPRSLASGLINHDGKWSWWLPVGAPALSNYPKGTWTEVKVGMIQTSPNVWLPTSVRVAELVDRCMSARAVEPSSGNIPLFTHSKREIRGLIQSILNSASSELDRTRRSAQTIESLQRWLPRKIAQDAGGDPAAASIISDRYRSLAHPMTYYGSLSIPKAIRIHSRATEQFDKHGHGACPEDISHLSVGDPNTPSDEAVFALIRELAFELESAETSAERQAGMVRQTSALLAFSLGLRGSGVLPSSKAIDQQTGFCLVADKDRLNAHAKRLVWVPPIARLQIAHYEDHLRLLKRSLGINANRQIDELEAASPSSLPLFRVHSSDRIESTPLKLVLKWSKKFSWPGASNAGRHWLRSKLSSECSAETLGAFFGHWQVGTEPWQSSSALDPLAYRADLGRCLNAVLTKVGWKALPCTGCAA
ncbi:hypothetical protein KUV75_07215 [Qipengyuania gaetbuli]|uniref:hypothetical protein n=1 Tax=Qipengyuania gaetbuli TaxID=266952 RepID=UPI001C99AE17|nr:hypothetical protein [Qipengyuania gaetbuli]MBY6014688.1 hypothetical protein [Qipengyuania gaetbuli]